MLNELLGGILQLTPGYMQGRQQAIKDNWQDLSNYNQVRAGQMNNALYQATMPYKIQQTADQTMIGHNQAEMSNNALHRDDLNTDAFDITQGEVLSQLGNITAQNVENIKQQAKETMRNNALRNQLILWMLQNNLIGGGAYTPWGRSSLLNLIGGNGAGTSAYNLPTGLY